MQGTVNGHRVTPSRSGGSTSPRATITVPWLLMPWVEVRPTGAIPGYQGLVVTIPSGRPEEDINSQIERLREERKNSGELIDVSGRSGR